MASQCGCEASTPPFIFLGMPIGSNSNRKSHWYPVIDKFKTKLSTWTGNLLSIGGRLNLIKFVLGGLGVYYLSLFKAPVSIIKSIEKLRARFFWGGSKEKRKMAWIKWDQVLASREKGGLDIDSIQSFNQALLLNWHWRFVHYSDSLWARTLVAIHGVHVGLVGRDCVTSGVWSNIIKTIKAIYASGIISDDTMQTKVGNGCYTKFWKDRWVGNVTLQSKYNRLFRLEKYPDCLICHRFGDAAVRK
ncbi:uncharacterized mitochondrial protein AtMg00310-like [Rutidosis leptorrhynchoides]|uniref:uncharacterized mitochondrial protein AtMg00310-like n=1 Tax=Rutidosis leptorrhynchoides TaxID=125765 RepID=UPI003A99CAC5